MGFIRHLSSDLNLVLTRISGDITDAMLRGHVRDLNEAAAELRGLRELVEINADVDVTSITVKATFDAAQLETGQPRSLGGKLAIYVTNELHYGMARVYGAGAGGTRAEFNVGYSVEEMVRWLANSDADYAAIREFVLSHWPEAPLGN